MVLLLLMISLTLLSSCHSDKKPVDDADCFCQLVGEIDDCSCHIESVDSFNNKLIFPDIRRLLEENYFRYYRLNLFRQCPFASSSAGQCGSKSCAVDECDEEHLPHGLKKNHSHSKNKYSEEAQEGDDCNEEEPEDNPLGDIDPHISEANKEAFERWERYDDSQDNFCEPEDEESPDYAYYDLVRNPERFTGYSGESAVNVWKLIYDQNCFKPDQQNYSGYLAPKQGSVLEGLCLEKRVFYRMISGFHTSINVDVTANWLISERNAWGAEKWGPNVEEFRKRFDPKLTWGEGPQRLKNLYFLYLVELRALAKAAPYLLKEDFFTGNEKTDSNVQNIVKTILDVVRSFPHHFDESQLFKDDRKQLNQFKVHFRNISRIMDCVGCDKCRLWGRIQLRGMGTALKILFSGDSMQPHSTVTQKHKRAVERFQLTRGEVVALFNAFGRLSKSIYELDYFRKAMPS